MAAAKLVQPVSELDRLKGERAEILTHLGELSRRRDTVLGQGVAEAEAALRGFEHDEAERVRAWAEAGCEGERPVADPVRHDALHTAVQMAKHAEKLAAPGLEAIKGQVEAQHCRLEELRVEIEAAACAEMISQFEAKENRSQALRAEILDIEADLRAGWHYFKNQADQSFRDTGRRRQHLDSVATSAANAFPNAAAARQSPDPDAMRAIARRFQELCQ
jgi:hypothetical protein